MGRSNKNGPFLKELRYVCLRWNAYRRGRINVANTYLESCLCYVLSIVSGKKYGVRHMHVSLDGFRQEDMGQTHSVQSSRVDIGTSRQEVQE